MNWDTTIPKRKWKYVSEDRIGGLKNRNQDRKPKIGLTALICYSPDTIRWYYCRHPYGFLHKKNQSLDLDK